jgi:hypothetical protein
LWRRLYRLRRIVIKLLLDEAINARKRVEFEEGNIN